MFSQTIEYALRAVVALASGDGSPMTTKDIARTMKIPQSYLSKVLQALVKAGVVSSTRGLKGGFVLARPARDLNMLQVMEAVSPIQRIETCPLDRASHSATLCPLHRRLDQAMAQVQEAFGRTTLAEVISEENPCPILQEQLASLKAGRPGPLQTLD